MSFINSPRRDDVLLREAGVKLDRALFPLLVRLGRSGPISVAGLAAQVGRDHTTISRQLAKLQDLGLIARQDGAGDRRMRTARLSAAGEEIVEAITAARLRLLSRALAGWREADLTKLANLNCGFAAALAEAASRE